MPLLQILGLLLCSLLLSAGVVTDVSAMQEAAFPMRQHSPLLKNARSSGELDYARLESERSALADEFIPKSIRENNLALISQELGDFGAAESSFQKALAAADNDGDKATISFNLGRLYQDLNDYERAEPLMTGYLNALVAGNANAATIAEVECDVAWLFVDMGDFPTAERMFLQARHRTEESKPRDDRFHVIVLHNLALLYEKLGRGDEAEDLLQKALKSADTLLDSQEVDRAHLLESLAFVLMRNGKLDEAEQPYCEALESYRKRFGEEHRSTARVTNNLGFLYARRGDHRRAEPLLEQAAVVRRKLFGESHSDSIDTRDDLAALFDASGRQAEAVECLREVLKVSREKLDMAANVQSERQQLLMSAAFRVHLDHYLSVTSRAKTPAAEVYEQLFAWKGQVFARGRCARLSTASDPAAVEKLCELRRIAGELSVLIDAAVPADQRDLVRDRVEALSAERERLERALFAPAVMARSAAQRQAGVAATPQRLFAALDGAVLVDFLGYTYSEPVNGKVEELQERRIVAFVVDSKGVRARVELGPEAEIEAAVDAWRAGFGRDAVGHAAAVKLREIVWSPLEPQLRAESTVLLSPDGPLGRFPFAAIPGKKPDSYLLAERTFVTIPVPRILAEPTEPDRPKTGEQGDILLVGGVDYESSEPETAQVAAAPRKSLGRRPQRGSDWKSFSPLDGTLDEITLIEKMFRDDAATGWRVTALERQAASEPRFVEEARRHRYLHVATHGFFAPTTLRAALDAEAPARASRDARSSRSGIEALGRHAGLLSGLALSGANRPPVAGQDDGILTAEEVQTLDLSGVEMAVLSACDTGLGDVAGGEGVLGLQRAFQASGARTTVTSLWKVDDLQTRVLMTQFYRNLLTGEMSTAEALRKSQLMMMESGPKRDIRLGGPQQASEAGGHRSPPYYWAPFVLSGDWR